VIYFLDTNIVVFCLRGRSPLAMRRLQATPTGDVAVPLQVHAELLLGAAKSANPQQSKTGPYRETCKFLGENAEVFDEDSASIEIGFHDRGLEEMPERAAQARPIKAGQNTCNRVAKSVKKGRRNAGDGGRSLFGWLAKAELIEGVVYMGSLTRVNEAGYLAAPPELIVKVAAISASIDLRDKRRACCRNGVREYLVWLVAEPRLEWFCLEDDDYRPQLPDAQGVLHSRVSPGLRLPVAPLLAGDTAKVLAALTGHEPLSTKPPETSVKSEDTGSNPTTCQP
jgi:hypothetical protein